MRFHQSCPALVSSFILTAQRRLGSISGPQSAQDGHQVLRDRATGVWRSASYPPGGSAGRRRVRVSGESETSPSLPLNIIMQVQTDSGLKETKHTLTIQGEVFLIIS